MRKQGLVLFIILIIVMWTFTIPPSIFAEGQTAWEIAKVYEAETASSLHYNDGLAKYNFYPANIDDIFLLVKFKLTAAKDAPPLDVQDIILVLDGHYKFHPVGFLAFPPDDWLVGESDDFTGTFTPEGRSHKVRIPGGDIAYPERSIGVVDDSLSSSFAYVVPEKYINGNHCFQLKIIGSGGVYFTVKPPTSPQGYISMSSDGNYIVVTRGRDLYLFGKSSSSPLWSYTANYLFNKPATISSDGTYILVAAQKKNLYAGPHDLLLFHKSSSEPLWTMNLDGYTAILSADGSRVASVFGNVIHLFDAKNGDLICKLGDPRIAGFTKDVAISSDGNYVVVAKGDKIYLFDGFKCSEVWRYGSGKDFTSFNAVSISSDGNYIGAIYYTSGTHTVLMFQRSSSTPIWDYTSSIDSSSNAYHSCVFSGDGNYLATWSSYKPARRGPRGRELTLFSRDSNTPMWSKDDFSSVIETVAVSSDGSFVSVCCGGEDDNTIYLLDRAGNTLWSHTGIGNQVAISQDGESIAVSSRTSLHLLKRDSSIETIFSFEREEISEFQLALQEGINLISVPLDPSGAKNGKQWRLSDLIDFIGSSATMIIRYDKAEKKFLTYMPNFPETSPANTVVQGGEGYIVMMKEPAGVTFTGTAWDGMVSLDAGINLISVPLNPCEEWRLNDLMSFIGKDATMIIKYDKTEKKFVTHMPDFPKNLPANSMVQGGEGYIVMMSAPVTVAFTGVAWENTTAASPPLIASTLDSKVTPFFVVEGFVHQKETGVARNNVKVVVKNLNNGLSGFDITGTVGDDGRYVVTFADLEGNCAAQVGDVIEVIALEPTGAFSGEPIRYTIKANDIKVGNVSLGDLLMSPIPKISALLQNYPNPFNPETWIPYQLSEEGDVSITIYDVSGRLVRILQLGQKRADFYITKSKSAYWDGRDELGQKVASGVYFYTLRTRDFATTRKMVIVK